jgi:hypothetical protein
MLDSVDGPQYLASENIAKHVAYLTQSLLFNGEFILEKDPFSKTDRIIFGQKIANILVAGPDLRVIIRIHFTDAMGDDVLKKYLATKEVSIKKIDDYFLECCNLIAGRLKQSFAENDFNVGISIPIKTKGYDDLFFAVTSNDDVTFEWHWDLHHEINSRIHFSLFIEILTDSQLSKMQFKQSPHEEVELF